jgi:hypothetical protein
MAHFVVSAIFSKTSHYTHGKSPLGQRETHPQNRRENKKQEE